MKILRKKPHETSKESYKHIIGNNGEDIQEYSSSRSYRNFSGDKWDKIGDAFQRMNSVNGIDNENIRLNNEIMKTDFRNKKYLRGIKHAFIVSNKSREKFKNGTYGN